MTLVTKETPDIYKLDHRIGLVHKQMKREFSPENYGLIQSYDNHMVISSLSKALREIHLKRLLKLTRLLDKNWSDVTKEDIDGLTARIMELYSDARGKETNSSCDHKKVLKIFFRWYKLGSREYSQVGDPPETKNVKTKKVGSKVSREELVTEDDKKALLEACKSSNHPSRDRAFIDCQGEAGTRPGEMLSLKIKNVKFDQYGANIYVDGKTGTRTIRLITSSPNLSQWLADHPQRENPEAPLWIEKDGATMSYDAAYRMIRRRCKDAKLNKRIYLNLFRHSEATETATYMTESQMRERHGWSKESKMPSRYVHLINADVERAIFERYGIIEKKDVVSKLPKMCPRCTLANPWDSNTCARCSMPFGMETVMELEKKEKQEKERMVIIEKTLIEILDLVTAGKASRQQIHKFKIIQKTLKDNHRLES